jgi:phage tail-like protein
MKRAEIERLLPGIYQRTPRVGGPLAALLDAMELMHAPAEAALEELDKIFDPRRTREPFVWYLARWVGLNRLYEQGADDVLPSRPAARIESNRLRELIAIAASLSKWRGTGAGLIRFLEAATGIRGYGVDERVPGPNGRPRPFHLRVLAPAAAAPQRALIERIIELEKPAYVTVELEFRLEPVRGGEET